jgi:hypothetical protein
MEVPPMKRALMSALLAALATGAVLATVGFGASQTATTSKSSGSRSAATTQSGPPKTMKQVYDAMQKDKAAREAKIAGALGVSTSRLQDAMDEIRTERLAADVKAGRLTDAQRDAILACEKAPLTCDRSNLPAGGPGHRDGRRGDRGDLAAALAKKLGVDQDKVEKALQAARPAKPSGMRGGRGHGHGPGGPMGGGPLGPGPMGG